MVSIRTVSINSSTTLHTAAYLAFTVHGRHISQQLNGAACRIGRGDQNTIALSGELVSRNHAMIQVAQAGIYYLHDLGSRNGTFLNGKRVTDPQPLADGDRILIGGHEIRFHQPASASAPVSAETISGVTAYAELQMVTVGILHLSQCDIPEACRRLTAKSANPVVPLSETITALWPHEGRRRDGSDVLNALETIYDIWRSATRDNPNARISAGINTGYAPPGSAQSKTAGDPSSYGQPVERAVQLQVATRTIHHDIAVGADAFDQLAQICPAEEHFCQRRLPLPDFPKPVRVYAINFAYLPPVLVAARQSLR
jgi:adenylate cyclase